MDKISSLGMSPGHPNKYPRGSSVKAWGCPRHPLYINKMHRRYIFIASCIMCYAWSVFIFCCVFTVFNKVGPHHILFWRETRSAASYLFWSETRSAVLHIYFGVRHAPLFCIMFTLPLKLYFQHFYGSQKKISST